MTPRSVARLSAASSLSSTTRTRAWVAVAVAGWGIYRFYYVAAPAARCACCPSTGGLSDFREHALDGLLGLPHVAAREEVGVVQQVIDVVETTPRGISIVQPPR